MLLSMCLVAIIVIMAGFPFSISYSLGVSGSIPSEQATFAGTGNENSKIRQWGMRTATKTIAAIGFIFLKKVHI